MLLNIRQIVIQHSKCYTLVLGRTWFGSRFGFWGKSGGSGGSRFGLKVRRTFPNLYDLKFCLFRALNISLTLLTFVISLTFVNFRPLKLFCRLPNLVISSLTSWKVKKINLEQATHPLAKFLHFIKIIFFLEKFRENNWRSKKQLFQD